MKKFEEYLKEEINAIDKKIASALTIKVYYGYKAGKVKKFASSSEAYAYCNNVECVDENEECKKDLRKQKQEILDKRYALWLADLREEYREYNDDQFRIFYSIAYEYHDDSEDNVVSMMGDLTHMYERVKGSDN